MKNISLDDRQEDPSKPSPPAISVPIPITPEREYAYAQEPASTPTPTPKPYTKPTVLSASVALTVNTDVAPEPGLETPSQTDSAPPKTPTPDSAPPMTPVANGSTTPGSSPEKPNVHRQVRSVGPSMLEKVISKTRPTHLPPKNKVEDVKHLKDSALWPS
ncbi:hypothetical protein BN14_04170 [Rhizoctonia solani AG-1 IB]|uniref:Uncharacterized protein n=1 Tax=Thanatephorus cucumeris (strain AG1-IB / isolate 7/3/14) TaxID=1108050 RepID=M5BSG8_THACB|nr:hypothetical protein BN14_04170 [Rhizoctonia solani AG-1 IB]